MGLTLTLLAAMDENHLLARKDGIPWHLPSEVAHFRSYAKGKWLLLGRTTFEEMRGWFNKNHMPLVLTTRCGWDPPMGRVVSSVPHALAVAEAAKQEELVCLGGGQTFAASLPHAQKMVLTTVHHRYPDEDGDVHFPEWDEEAWLVTRTERHAKDGENKFAYTIRWMERREAAR
jgi:dihydrofolate reductase